MTERAEIAAALQKLADGQESILKELEGFGKRMGGSWKSADNLTDNQRATLKAIRELTDRIDKPSA